jgi:hypothetical protein
MPSPWLDHTNGERSIKVRRFPLQAARFTLEAVEQTLADLADRIRTNNDDSSSEYAVSEAVAFGDLIRNPSR